MHQLQNMLLRSPSMSQHTIKKGRQMYSDSQYSHSTKLKSHNNINPYQQHTNKAAESKPKYSFPKPQVQTLMHENIQLKIQKQQNQSILNKLTMKNRQLQKKLKKLEKISIEEANNQISKPQKQFQWLQLKRQNTNQSQQNIDSSFRRSTNQNFFKKPDRKPYQGQSNKLRQHFSSFLRQSPASIPTQYQSSIKDKVGSKAGNDNSEVYIQILKKKNELLTFEKKQIQNELEQIKRLPYKTIYQQNDIEKDHLLAQTVRLKAILVAFGIDGEIESKGKVNSEAKADEAEHASSGIGGMIEGMFGNMLGPNSADQGGHSSNASNELPAAISYQLRFKSQFMKLTKEQNQKLKAAIRLLQNDKILLKSRLTIQGKLNLDLKKQVQSLRQKIIYKQAQSEKLNNENKNLLFKKTAQFRLQQKKKENQEISILSEKNEKMNKEIKRLEQNILFLTEQNSSLKEKQKMVNNSKSQIQLRYSRTIKELKDRNDELSDIFRQLTGLDLEAIRKGGAPKRRRENGHISQEGQQVGLENGTGGQSIRERERTQQSIRPKAVTLIDRFYEKTLCSSQKTQISALSRIKQRKKTQCNQELHSNQQVEYFSNQQEAGGTKYCYPIKWQDIEIGLMSLYHGFIAGPKNSNYTIAVLCQQECEKAAQYLLEQIGKSQQIQEQQSNYAISYSELLTLFSTDSKIRCSKKQAILLARFFTEKEEDQQSNKANYFDKKLAVNSKNGKILVNEKACIQVRRFKSMVRACLQKVSEKIGQKYETEWKNILLRSRKTLESIRKQYLTSNAKKTISKEQMIRILSKNIRVRSNEWITWEYLYYNFFDKQRSQQKGEYYVKFKQMILFLQNLIE